MFERFTKKARQVVVLAQEQAHARGADIIGTEHLLVATFLVPDSLAAAVLMVHGLDRDSVEAEVNGAPGPFDPAALATLGIDLDQVRRQVEEAFGAGALDRTNAAQNRTEPSQLDRTSKKVLKLALTEARRLGNSYVGTEHILLGMLHPDTGVARQILERRGMRLEPTRNAVDQLLGNTSRAS